MREIAEERTTFPRNHAPFPRTLSPIPCYFRVETAPNFARFTSVCENPRGSKRNYALACYPMRCRGNLSTRELLLQLWALCATWYHNITRRQMHGIFGKRERANWGRVSTFTCAASLVSAVSKSREAPSSSGFSAI